MFDIKFIRENPDAVQQNATNKGYADLSVAKLLELDKAHRELLAEIETLRESRNQIANQVKKSNGKPDDQLLKQGKEVKEKLAALEDDLRTAETNFTEYLKKFPNMALPQVPVGRTEDENVVIREVGEKPVFDFTPLSHADLAEKRGWLDVARAVKIAGSRFVYVMGDLARLEFALFQYGIDVLTDQEKIREIIEKAGLTGKVSDKPFTFVLPPAVAKTAVFEATGRLNKTEQTYKIADEDLWLNASAEHTMAPMFMNEILDEKDLPIRLLGYTTAFRREAGTYGKDTEGMFRLHQFNKLEMESFTTKEQSYDEHLFQIAIQEYLMQSLGLPYRVVEKCTADIGRPNAKGVDIDTWIPSQNAYRETHTADHITDFQTRAMKTRVRFEDSRIELARTNDATVFSERPLIALLENFQGEDGKVKVPEVLRKYLGKENI